MSNCLTTSYVKAAVEKEELTEISEMPVLMRSFWGKAGRAVVLLQSFSCLLMQSLAGCWHGVALG